MIDCRVSSKFLMNDSVSFREKILDEAGVNFLGNDFNDSELLYSFDPSLDFNDNDEGIGDDEGLGDDESVDLGFGFSGPTSVNATHRCIKTR